MGSVCLRKREREGESACVSFIWCSLTIIFIFFFIVLQVPCGSSSDGRPEIITAYPNLGVLPIISFFGFFIFCFGTERNLLIETADKERFNNRSELKKKKKELAIIRLLQYDVGTSRRTNSHSSATDDEYYTFRKLIFDLQTIINGLYNALRMQKQV